jgi:ribonuclease HII
LIERYLELEAFDRLFLPPEGEFLAGVDEAGRGAIAGPVVAAAVILPDRAGLVGVRDSKEIPEAEREALFEQVVRRAISVGIAVGSPRWIDRDNILQTTLAVMARAVSKLRPSPTVVLVDGRDGIVHPGRVLPIPGGDRKSLAIAAASIVAKVTRDRIMRRLHLRYPEYHLERNKGYGTREHREAIARFGLAPFHRRSFAVKGVEPGPSMV